MEIIFELLLGILQIFCEIILQLVIEGLLDFGLHTVNKPFRPPKPLHPVLAAIVYALLGAAAGALSLWIFPNLFIDSHAARIANLIVTPLIAGAVMAGIGAWRRKKDQELIRLDRFAYGFLFALAMAVVRFAWGH